MLIRNIRKHQTGAIGSTLLLLIIVTAIAAFFIWANTSSLDIVTRSTGVVIPSSRIQSIQSLEGGILKEMFVQEGDIVEKGDIIVRMDEVNAAAMYREAIAKKVSLETTIVRLSAEILDTKLEFSEEAERDFPRLVQGQRVLFEKLMAAKNQEIAVLSESLKLTKEELALNEPMLETGEVSKVDVIRLRRQVNEIKGAIAQVDSRFFSEAQTELVKAHDELGAHREIVIARRNVVEHAEITAPVRGVVKNIRITTLGGVVRAAEEIMQIVPIDDELLIELKIKSGDVAFLRPGLPVSIKIDAYDYMIYGMLDGKLTYLSPDTLREESSRDEEKYYRGIVTIAGTRLRNPHAEKIEVIPGMTAQGDIKTGTRTVMEYLLKPLTRGLQESLREQ